MNLFDHIEYASLSDTGVVRSHNQDNLAVSLATSGEQWAQHGHLFLVADGMGGHAFGEKASEQAARVIPHTYHKHFQEGPANALRKALSEANASIHAIGQANRDFEGTGTTSTALVVRPDGAWIGHVGDSRVYRIRDGYIDQLSFDHSLVWEYARLKGIDPSKVKDIRSNVIHRCLGPEPLVQVDIEGPHPLKAGDIFLLCSDGLSGQLSDREIGAVATALPPEEACNFLVHLANLRGGPDNITVLIVRIKVAPEANGADPETLPQLPPRWPRPPWQLASLVGGTLLAAAAISMRTAHVDGAIYFFLGGSLAILAGLFGLLVHARRTPLDSADPGKNPAPRVHRRTACSIETPILDRLAKAVRELRQYAVDRHWEPDTSEFQTHLTDGEQLLADKDLPGAFRELCLALLPLADAVKRNRAKGEDFKPFWN